MRLLLFLTCVGLSFAVARAEPADDLGAKFPLLGRLAPQKDQLPPNCVIQELPANDPDIKGLKNPGITTDSRFFSIGDERLKDLLDVKKVQATFFSVYSEKRKSNECGIIGWAFATTEDAKKARQSLADSYAKEQDRFRLWQKDQYLIWLWRDPVITDTCFKYFEAFVEEQINPK